MSRITILFCDGPCGYTAKAMCPNGHLTCGTCGLNDQGGCGCGNQVRELCDVVTPGPWLINGQKSVVTEVERKRTCFICFEERFRYVVEIHQPDRSNEPHWVCAKCTGPMLNEMAKRNRFQCPMCRTPFQRSDMQSTDLMKLIIRDEGAIVFCPHRCGFEGKVEDLLRHLLQCPLFNWREEWMRLSGSPGCTKLNVGSMLPLILNKLISLTQTAGTDEEITELLDFFFNKYIPHVSPDGDFCRDAGCRHENCIEQHKVQWLNADTTVVRVIVHVMLEMISRKGRVDFSSRGFRQFLHRRSYYVAENWWDVFYYIPGGVSLLSKVLTYELRNLSYALRDPNELQDSSNLCRVNNLLIRMDLRGLSGLLTPEVIDALINYLTHYIRCYDPQLFVVCKAHVGFASVFKLLLSAYKRLHSPNDVVRQRVDKIVRGLIKGLKVWSTEEWGKELSDESFQSFFENILECLEIVLGLCSTDHKWDVKTCDCFMHVLQLARTKAMLKGIVTGEPSAIRTRLDFVTSEFEDNRPLQPSLKRFCCNGARASK